MVSRKEFIAEAEIIRYLTRESVRLTDSDFADEVKKKSRRYQAIDGKIVEGWFSIISCKIGLAMKI